MLTLDPPASLGLPDKFPAWRPLQTRAISDGTASSKRFIAQSLSTGSGKSLGNVMQGMLAGRAVYLTATKALQKQLLDDFESCGMTDVRGRSNYTCAFGRSGNVTCEDGMHLGCRAHKEGACDYVNTVNAARVSSLPETNYYYWMSQNKYGEGLGDVDLLICDEVDSALDAICSMMLVELTHREIHGLHIAPPSDAHVDSMDDWRAFARTSLELLKTQIEQNTAAVKREPGNADMLRILKQARALAQKLGMLATSQGAWVVDKLRDYGNNNAHAGWRFDPVWPTQYAEELLFCNVPRVLLTSATMSRKTCKLLGIADTDLDYFNYPPAFDARRSPITWVKSGARVDEHMSESDIRGWIARIDQILRSRPNLKGIIHCTSYARQKDIYRLSSERSRLIWHNSWNTQAKIEEYKQAADDSGKVLISPAVTAGYNFPGAECRFQIIAKLPLLFRSSKIMRARLREDADYCDYLESQTFRQEIGRPVRAPDDWCQHFVVDDHWAWWYPKMARKGLLPQSFCKQVTSPSDGIPRILYAA